MLAATSPICSGEVKVNTEILKDPRYSLMFSVEEVNHLTLEGVPFRDAYKQVGLAIERGEFVPPTEVHHTHEGSIGNLCNDALRALFDKTVDSFDFTTYHAAVDSLLGR